MGGGTFGFCMAEFEIGLRHDLPFVAVIGNDDRWHAKYQIRKRAFGASRKLACVNILIEGLPAPRLGS